MDEASKVSPTDILEAMQDAFATALEDVQKVDFTYDHDTKTIIEGTAELKEAITRPVLRVILETRTRFSSYDSKHRFPASEAIATINAALGDMIAEVDAQTNLTTTLKPIDPKELEAFVAA